MPNTLLYFCLLLTLVACKPKHLSYPIQKINQTALPNGKWQLLSIQDAYSKEKEVMQSIATKKLLSIKGDTIVEYYYPNRNATAVYKINAAKNLICYAKDGRQVYQYAMHNDSLILTSQGRHGPVKETYLRLK